MLHTEQSITSENNQQRIIPKLLPGGVYEHFVLCRRTGVRYRYFRRQWYEGGKLRKEYVRFNELEAVRAACAEHRRVGSEERAAWSVFRQALRELRGMGL